MVDIVGLTGNKVRLVPPDKANHLENVLRWFNDPEVVQYLVLNYGVTRGMEEEWFDRVQKRDVTFVWAILDENGRHIGFTEIDGINWRRRSGQTGTLIGERTSWGKGYGTDAMRVRTRFAFETLGLHRLTSGVRIDNIASQRALERVGYRREGIARRAQYWSGHWYDIVLYGILDEDYFKGGTARAHQIEMTVRKSEVLVSMRRATLDEAPLLAQMNKRLIEDEGHRNPMTVGGLEERMREWLNGSWNVDVFLDGGGIVGHAVHQTRADELYPNEKVVYLRQFFIERSYRGQGWGALAFETLSKTRFPEGAVVILDVLASNPRGQRFWERLGFRPYRMTMKLLR